MAKFKIKAINKATGEVIELDADTPEQIVEAWKIAQEYEKAAKSLKDQLKKIVPSLVNDDGKSDEINNAVFKINTIQRMTYDKSVVRQVLDEDVFDLMTKIDKTKLDNYIKDNLSELGDISTELRASLIPDGKPYQVIRLERL